MPSVTRPRVIRMASNGIETLDEALRRQKRNRVRRWMDLPPLKPGEK